MNNLMTIHFMKNAMRALQQRCSISTPVELSEAKAVACFSSVIHVPITSTATSIEIGDWTSYETLKTDIDADSDME